MGALYFAASKRGHSEIVKELLKHNLDVNTADNYGWTPLLIASKHGHSEIVKELLKHNPDVNAVDSSGRTPLLIASKRGYLEIVKELFRYNPELVNAVDNNGWTPLFYASWKGRLDTVKELLKYNPDVNAADAYGRTPLRVAILSGHTEVAEFLIQETLVRNYKAGLDYLEGEYLTHRNKCAAEINKMKEHKICNSEISFFDILVADKKKLASYVNDYDVVKVLDAYDCEKKFSIYADKIKSQYTKGMNEKVAEDIVLNLSTALNEYTSRMIFDHLNDKKIRHLCIAGYRNLIEKRHTNTETAPERPVGDDAVSSCFSGIRLKECGESVTL